MKFDGNNRLNGTKFVREAVATRNFAGTETFDQLSVEAGNQLLVLKHKFSNGWVWASNVVGRQGFIPETIFTFTCGRESSQLATKSLVNTESVAAAPAQPARLPCSPMNMHVATAASEILMETPRDTMETTAVPASPPRMTRQLTHSSSASRQRLCISPSVVRPIPSEVAVARSRAGNGYCIRNDDSNGASDFMLQPGARHGDTIEAQRLMARLRSLHTINCSKIFDDAAQASAVRSVCDEHRTNHRNSPSFDSREEESTTVMVEQLMAQLTSGFQYR